MSDALHHGGLKEFRAGGEGGHAGPSLQFRSGGADLFPLPYFASLPPKRGVSRTVAQRRDRIRKATENCNEAVFALNWMAGCGDMDGDHRGGMHDMVLSRMEGLIYDQEPKGGAPKPEEALRALLKGADPYDGSGAHMTLASYQADLVSLPEDITNCPLLGTVLGDDDQKYLEEGSELMMRSKSDLVDMQTPVEPYWDPILKFNRKEYNKLVSRLASIGYFQYTTKPQSHVGVFFVYKSNRTKLRMITDARRSNQLFRDPPPVGLMTAEGFGRFELSLDGDLLGDDQVQSAFEVFLGLSDVRDCFHRMRVPHWMARYFCWKPVPAKVVGMTGHCVDGRILGPLDPIYPCAGSLCQGFSWALYFAQMANQNIAGKVPSLRKSFLVHDRGPPVVLRVGRGGQCDVDKHYYVYVDNLGVLHPQRESVEEVMRDLQAAFNGAGLLLHGSEISSGATDALGCTVEGNRLRSRVSNERLWKIHHGIKALLKRGRCTGKLLEVIVGHCTFAGLMNRQSLSVFHAVYKFIRRHYSQSAPLWKSVRDELKAFSGLLFLLVQDWWRQWNGLVASSDSSLSGYGVCQAWWPKHEVAEVGRVLERTRFRRAAGHSARESALVAAGFELKDDTWLRSSRSGHQLLLEAGWELDTGFPEVPAAGLVRRLWMPTMWGRWTHKEGILTLEARTVLKTLRRIALTRHGHSIRQLLLCDHMSVVLSIERFRSKNFKLLAIIRKIAAYCFSRNIFLAIRWIPSELNIADEPSRIFDEEDSKLLVDSLSDTWPEFCFSSPNTHFHEPKAGAAAKQQQQLSGSKWNSQNWKSELTEKGVASGSGDHSRFRPQTDQEGEVSGSDLKSAEAVAAEAGEDTSVARNPSGAQEVVGGDSDDCKRSCGRDILQLRRKQHFVRVQGREKRRQASWLAKQEKRRLESIGGLQDGGCEGQAQPFGECCSHGACEDSLHEPSCRLHGFCEETSPGHGSGCGYGPGFGDVFQRALHERGGQLCGRLYPGGFDGSEAGVWPFGTPQGPPGLEVFEGMASTMPVKVAIGTSSGNLVRHILADGSSGSPSDGNLQPCPGQQLSPTKCIDQPEEARTSPTNIWNHKVLGCSDQPQRDFRHQQDWNEGRLGLAGFELVGIPQPPSGRAEQGRQVGERMELQLPPISISLSSMLFGAEGGCGPLPGSTFGPINRPCCELKDPGRGQEERRMAGKAKRCSLREGWKASGDLAETAISSPANLQSSRKAYSRNYPRPAIPKHLPAMKGSKGRYVADLFSGHGGVSKAVRKMGFNAREWELLKGDEHDLTNPCVVFKVCENVRKEKILAAMMAPPCSSFSCARDRTSVIRNRQYPWGIDGISEADAKKVQAGNKCFLTCFKLIKLFDQRKVPWVLENPHSSKCWFLPQLLDLEKQDNVQIAVSDFCRFGAKWRKRTRFMVGNVCPSDVERIQKQCSGKRGMCSTTQERHFQLTGSGPGNIPWTRIAQPYPKQLCHSLAHVLLSSTLTSSLQW